MLTCVIWIEFITQLYFANSLTISKASGMAVIFGYFPLLLYWLIFRQHLIDSLKIKQYELHLSSLMKDDFIFHTLLSKEIEGDVKEFPFEIKYGSPTAKIKIILVTNPLCGVCAKAHSMVERIMYGYENKVEITFRFANILSNPKSKVVLKEVFDIMLTNNNLDTIRALSLWYTHKDLDLVRNFRSKLNNSYAFTGTTSDDLISIHSNWSEDNDIKATPTFFVNGKKTPNQFGIDDLEFHIRKWVRIKP